MCGKHWGVADLQLICCMEVGPGWGREITVEAVTGGFISLPSSSLVSLLPGCCDGSFSSAMLFLPTVDGNMDPNHQFLLESVGVGLHLSDETVTETVVPLGLVLLQIMQTSDNVPQKGTF